MVKGLPNHAMASQANRAMSAQKGGIDMGSINTHLDVKSGTQVIRFKIDPAHLAQLQNAPGFTVGSISIQPLKSLSAFLGLVDK